MHVYVGFSLAHKAHTKSLLLSILLGLNVGDRKQKSRLEATGIPSEIINNCVETQPNKYLRWQKKLIDESLLWEGPCFNSL